MPEIAHSLTRMTGRDRHERGRVGSTLELLFDLTFVVAFGVAGNEAAHLVSEGENRTAVFGFCFVMFAVIWAWINFTWFASAFDVDDWFYRLVTMLQMIGVLIFAMGIAPLFDSLHHGHVDNTVIVMGYVVMRVAMIIQWLRAYREAPEYRSTARIYIITLVVAQIGWVIQAFAHVSLPVFIAAAAVLILIELAGPFVGETRGSGTPWHPHHIAERYGALAIITLGEGVVGTVAAESGAVQRAGGWTGQAVLVVTAGIGLTFALWWMYFAVEHAEGLHASPQKSFLWGYGHLPLFAALAAVGAGLHIAGYVIEGDTHASMVTAVAWVAVPVAVVLVMLVLLHSWLFAERDSFHLLLIALTLVVLAIALWMARAGVSMGWCLIVVMLSPVVAVLGFETVGYRHQAQMLERVRARHEDG